jgi:hypothetical protein
MDEGGSVAGAGGKIGDLSTVSRPLRFSLNGMMAHALTDPAFR